METANANGRVADSANDLDLAFRGLPHAGLVAFSPEAAEMPFEEEEQENWTGCGCGFGCETDWAKNSSLVSEAAWKFP